MSEKFLKAKLVNESPTRNLLKDEFRSAKGKSPITVDRKGQHEVLLQDRVYALPSYVYRMPRKVRKVHKVKAKIKPANRGKRYNGSERRMIAAALKKMSVTAALRFLASERGLVLSPITARKIAAEKGIELKDGRSREAA